MKGKKFLLLLALGAVLFSGCKEPETIPADGLAEREFNTEDEILEGDPEPEIPQAAVLSSLNITR